MRRGVRRLWRAELPGQPVADDADVLLVGMLQAQAEAGPTAEVHDRVVRGGAFFNLREFVRCSYRNWGVPYLRNSLIGFRVCLSPFL